MAEIHGEVGLEWLARLPLILAELSDRWKIALEPPLPGLSYHYVAPAQDSMGRERMVKCGPPVESLRSEVTTLNWFRGAGAVSLIEADLGLGALLLERVRPGTSASEVPEEEAVSAFATVARALHRPAVDVLLPTVREWGLAFRRLRDRFVGGTGPIPRGIFDEAESVYTELSASMDTVCVLHGDLHHGNLLASERGAWVAIDPQGVLGESVFEAGAFLRNPMPEMLELPNLDTVLARRMDQLSERLPADRTRLAGWGFSQAVLATLWTLEDHGGGWEEGLRLAGALADVYHRRRSKT